MMRSMFRKMMLTGFAVLAAALLSPGAAHAQAILTPGNNPQPGDENVLMNNGTTGSTVVGATNQTGLPVSFSVTNNALEGTLSEPSSGQARVEALDGTLNNVGIQVVNGSFTSLIFNPINGTGNLTVDVNYLLNNVPTTQTFVVPLGNGNNFQTLTLVPVNSQTHFTKVTLTAAGPANGFADLRQVRIGGATMAPEPSTLALAVPGLLPTGLMFLRRRKKARSG